ncbi:hypothetical protein MNEG_3606 [Monoraphidium neglectum]|uniref:Uncharacterized protein n=1 Tax=Monoraphidium neglectum TaxID=145388 RepID=A0A0D2NH44_9CHLO|nr:hypothetical protein MNEG_3606 [Monoraphidium neglectum]KIZ04351.1 hypothetical protein MNEG_3606 [Monoraphidium neglectum]|eukprot:XP_013903370.1 hypothetical protein MNEG_3606 [Monoraphidium neglectum]
MTRHTYTPIGGPAERTTPKWCKQRARQGLFCFGTVAAVLFVLAYWPGAPLQHGPGLSALALSRKDSPSTTAAVELESGKLTPKQADKQQQPVPKASAAKEAKQAAATNEAPAGASAAKAQAAKPSAPGAPAAAKPATAAGDKAASSSKDGSSGGSGSPPSDKALLELFVMSLCPDADFCEHYFDKLLDKLHPIVHVKTEYIQHASGGAVTCPHGDSECTGNKYQLCVGRHTPPEHNRDWFLKFLVCTWDGGDSPSSKAGVKACLDKVGVLGAPRQAMEACMDGPEGAALMAASAGVTASRGMQRSCTVAIAGKKRCIRDGGRWYDCPGGDKEEDFVRSLCDAYRAKTGKDSPLCPAKPTKA